MTSIVLVGGSIAANFRNGGIAWERLSWALGLRRLGFEVVVVDQLDSGRCVYADGAEPTYANCLNRPYLEKVVTEFGLSDSIALVGDRGESLFGRTYDEVLELAEAAEMLVNVAGNVRLEELRRRSRLNVYVDVDPGLTQLWLASGAPAPRIEGHDLYFTIGENVGTGASRLPTSGIDWHHTRQPVLLDEWPVAPSGDSRRFTTVARWRGSGPHGALEAQGIVFGQKADEFAKVIELPTRVPATFELALDIDSGDTEAKQALSQNGWKLVDPREVASGPGDFREYVQASAAEFSVAKGAYAATNSGWFSDRTTRYLASGKPALVQNTGFGERIPVGDGLLSFVDADDAVAGAQRILADYEHHAKAAREVAENYFASDDVLGRFVADVRAARPV